MGFEEHLKKIDILSKAIHCQGTGLLKDLEVKDHVKTVKAYRAIVLTDGLDDKKEQKAQLDSNLIYEPYRSWSKTQKGATQYYENWGVWDYIILVSGLIEGIDLDSLTSSIINDAEIFLNKKALSGNSLKPTDEESFKELRSRVNHLKVSVNRYKYEEEIIALKVISFEFIESGKLNINQ
jgi:hypothetical protein